MVPVKPGGEIIGPILDTRTGQIVSHGTQSQYRSPEIAASTNIEVGDFSVSLNDNFLVIVCHASSSEAAVQLVVPYVDLLVQSLTSMYGQRFSASFLSAEDESGVPQKVMFSLTTRQLFKVTIYNTEEISERVATAARWAAIVDDVAQKALFYFEHACLLQEFSESLPLLSPHAAFSRALAFL